MKLSVIVPCYNSETTVEQAVASIFQQKPIFPFDVTLVDDGSADSTYDVIRRLARSNRRIRVIRHPQNLGGGAARNTGAAESDGDLIFCLDADDVLGPAFLENMTRFWSEKRCDAVGISTSMKFRGMDLGRIEYATHFEGPGKAVRFESFFQPAKCSLDVVFLMTRAAFGRVGGYPTEHGFDTQGMAFRFLCHGLPAYTCPDAVYFHRVGMPKSYYMREQEAGRINWNWLNVLDEFLYLFRDPIKAQLLEHPLFEAPGEDARTALFQIVEGGRGIFAPEYKRWIRMGPARVAREFRTRRDKYKQYWVANYLRSRGEYEAAISHYARALKLGFRHRMVFYRTLQAELALSGKAMPAAEALEEVLQYSRPYPVALRPWRQRIFHAMLGTSALRGAALWLKSVRDRVIGRKSR